MNAVDEFLDGNFSKHTIRIYKKSLEMFFNAVNSDPNTYFDEERDHDNDIRMFIKSLSQYKPYTKKARINCVRLFLEENEVVFTKQTKRKIKGQTKRCKPTVQDIVSTPKELKEILQHGTLKDRALFLFASSSGMRIDEILQLTKEDIPAIKKHENHRNIDFPVKIYVRAETTKTNTARIAFISNEAWDTLLEWLKDRPAYLHQAARKSIRKKWENDPHLFPYTYPTAWRMWVRLLNKSGYNERDQSSELRNGKKTKRYRRHIHTLRKYFRIYASPQATKDVVELLMGHEDTLGDVYRKQYPESKLADMYLKAMPDISVFERNKDLTEVNESLKQKDKKITNMEKEMELMKQKIHLLELDKKVNDIANGKKKK